jgi:hypothetical protein
MSRTVAQPPPVKLDTDVSAVPPSARAAVVGRLTSQMQHLRQQFQEVQQMMGQLQQPV